jgi:hypothetical protein
MSLNAIYNFDYEFSFENNDIIDTNKFDIIYNQCTLPDPSGNRKELIYKKCLEIVQLLLAAPGFRIFSSFVNVDNKRYKVTISNTIWAGEGLF